MHFDGGFTAVTIKQGLSSDIVSALYEDRGGTMWIGTAGGGISCRRLPLVRSWPGQGCPMLFSVVRSTAQTMFAISSRRKRTDSRVSPVSVVAPALGGRMK